VMQDDIVSGIVTTLGLLFKVDTLQLRNVVREDRQTDNLEAFDAYLRGTESFSKLTKDDNAKARQMFQKAVGLDPTYAEAYALIGWTYENDADYQWSHDAAADLKRASEFAQKALALDDSSITALMLASDNDRMNRRFDEAVRDAQRAVRADPNYSVGYFILASALNADGESGDAVPALQKASRLDPALEDFFAQQLGFAYLHLGRYEQAISALNRYSASNPNDFASHVGLANSYIELGRDQDARTEAAEVMRLNPQFTLPPLEKSPWDKDIARARHINTNLRKAGLK
jgi:adenylate cyclase